MPTLGKAFTEIAKERADWLVDAVACATQDRRFLRGEPEADDVAIEAILLNAQKAIEVAIERAVLALQLAQEGN
jgi:hypothetical protein